MARACTFNWSSLDRQTLFDLLYLIRANVVGKTMSVDVLHNIIIQHLKTYLPIRGKKGKDIEVLPGWVYIGGCYYSDYDREKQKSIELSLYYNKLEKNITLTSRRFNSMCVSFADTILHEIIHMRQYRRRQFKSLPGYASTAEKTKQREEQSYLGDMDEIDAYSFNIACELNAKFYGKDKDIVNYLNKNQNGLRRRSNCWRMYLKAFDHNHNHPIIKKVKKRVLYYLPRAKMGKPYQTKDWISS